MLNLNLEEMRISQKYEDEFSGEEVRNQVRVKKPGKQMWFRAHPDPEMQIDTYLLEYAEDKSFYYVHPEAMKNIRDDVKRVRLLTCVSLAQEVFLWPIKLPNGDGNPNPWNTSALAAADVASHSWVRVYADMNQSRYRTIKASADYGEPNWPEESLQDLVNLAFQDHYIADSNHPVIKSLMGRL